MRVGMLTAAYDARMDGRKAFLSAGGLVSSVVDWTDFNGKWRDRLAQRRLKLLSHGGLSHSVGDFEPLGETEREKTGAVSGFAWDHFPKRRRIIHGTPKSMEFTPPSDPSGSSAAYPASQPR